jgi:hypothetical protein
LYASFSTAGSSFFNLSPCFRIVVASLGLKKYSGGRSPVVSKMSDNKDSWTSSGATEVFSVKHTPRERIPEFIKRILETCEVPSSVGRKDTSDIFPEEPARFPLVENSCKDKGKVSSGISESSAETRD